MKNWYNQKTKDLISALLSLKNEKEAKSFLRDLMTENEITEFGNRWQAACLLWQKISYLEIQKKTSLSTRTIARISDWLKNGKGGYKLIINRLSSHHINPSYSRKS